MVKDTTNNISIMEPQPHFGCDPIKEKALNFVDCGSEDVKVEEARPKVQ